jgi:hypothetical protein
MGILTKAMTQLREEILSSRHSRLSFRGELVRQTVERRSQVSALCTAFARDRAGAHRVWFGRTPAGREVAESERQRSLGELAGARAHAERKTETHEPAKPAPAPTARPPVAPSPSTQRPPLKGSKKALKH